MVADADRRALYVALSDSLGQGPATTLMDLLPPVDWSEIARRSDIDALRVEVRGEIAGLRGEMGELRGELRGEIGELRGKIDSQVTRLMVANVPAMFGVAGLVLAAAKLG